MDSKLGRSLLIAADASYSALGVVVRGVALRRHVDRREVYNGRLVHCVEDGGAMDLRLLAVVVVDLLLGRECFFLISTGLTNGVLRETGSGNN